jgi:hypothetical protein
MWLCRTEGITPTRDRVLRELCLSPVNLGFWIIGIENHQQPITNNQQPTTNNQQPITNNQQPTTNNQQPTTNNQQPTTNNF